MRNLVPQYREAKNLTQYQLAKKVGLDLADENSIIIFHSTFKNKTREAVRNGRCKRIVNGQLVKTNAEN